MNKRFMILAVILTTIFASCTKIEDVDLNDNAEMTEVTFRVNPLSIETGAMQNAKKFVPGTRGTASGNEIADVIQSIEYVIKGTSSTIHGKQSTSDPNFGEIVVRMPLGNYTAFFWAAGKESATGSAYYSKYADSYTDPHCFIWADDKDVFAVDPYNLNIEDNSTKDVNLTRQTGKITIEIQDLKPEDVDHIDVVVSSCIQWNPFNTFGSNVPKYEYSNYPHEKTMRANTDGSFDEYSVYCFPGSQDAKVEFTLYDGNGANIGTASINAPVYKNRQTIIRGNLFDLIAGTPFSIFINDEWGEDNVVNMN